MKIEKMLLVGLLSVSPALLPLAPSAFAADSPGFAAPGTVANFQVTDKTQIPGQVLKAGSYSITVIDHLSDRMVVRVAGSDGKEEATFLALPAGKRLANAPARGPIPMAMGKGKSALRGFVFPDGSVAEFVYPKAEAVDLAKANSVTVPAIDPASEGRSASPSLSKTDRELVTLWMLTPTVVNGTAAMDAKRYQPEVAAAVPPPPPPPAPGSGRVRPPQNDVPPPPPPPVKPRKVAHPIAALPHTASEMPLVALTGLCCMLAGAMLSVRRLRANGGR